LRQLQRAERQQRKAAKWAETERAYAALWTSPPPAARPPAPPLIKSGPWVGFAVVGCWVLVLVVLALMV
jgi:hypothetical protein